MATPGAPTRTYTWIAAHAPWSAWARRNTTFTVAAIPPALPALLGLTYAALAPGRSPIPLLLVLVLCPLLTTLQRSRFWALLGLDVPEVVRERSWWTPRGLAERLRSEATWRQYGYHLLVSPIAAAAGALVVLAWVCGAAGACVYAWCWILPHGHPYPRLDRRLRRRHRGPASCCCSPRPGRPPSWPAWTHPRRPPSSARTGPGNWSGGSRTSRRAGPVLDAADLERRRIERDLHDGAQQRLVALAMNLGIARATLTDLPPEAKAVIDEAHREAKEAIEELSSLVRGLHPAVLEDRGLDAALSGIAARAPFHVELTVDIGTRPGATIEAVAYFVVSETLANVAKHARADRCSVRVVRDPAPGGAGRREDLLRVTVTDDGVGGADPAGGTGLVGLRKRVGSVDGTIMIDSPLGGPTVITVELPCAL